MSRPKPRPPELRQTREVLFDFTEQPKDRYPLSDLVATIPTTIPDEELYIEVDMGYDHSQVRLVRTYTAAEDVEHQQELLALHRVAMREWQKENDRLAIGERAKGLSDDDVVRVAQLLDELESNND